MSDPAPDDGRDEHPSRSPGERARRPLHPVEVAGVAAVAGGLLAWLWLGDWRWALTGAVVMLVLLVTGASLNDRRS